MEQGEIHYRNIYNAVFIIRLNNEKYVVFEGFSISQFKIGDKVSGKLDQPGTVNILNATTQKNETIHIRKTGLSLEEAIKNTEEA